MSFERLFLAGESNTLDLRTGFDKVTVESLAGELKHNGYLRRAGSDKGCYRHVQEISG